MACVLHSWRVTISRLKVFFHLVTFSILFGLTAAFHLDNPGEELKEKEANELFKSLLPPQNLELIFKLEEHWPTDASLLNIGSISAAVPLDNGKRLLVLHRAGRHWDRSTFLANNVLRDPSEGPIRTGVLAELNSGTIVGSHLKNRFYLPHGLSVDQKGNVWITDVGLHQVFKFSPDLKEEPLLILGEALHPGNDATHFCKPTHVVVASSGDFFVSDGYCNNRIMKFDSSGKLRTQWGWGTVDPSDPGPSELNVPHEMILVEDEDLICVADRENYRVVCYNAGLSSSSQNMTGQFVTEFRTELSRPGPVYGVAFHPYTHSLFVLVGSVGGNIQADVQVYNIDSKRYFGRLRDGVQGFDGAHTISTCNSSEEAGCVLISSLKDPSVPEQTRGQNRRLWLYRMLSVTSD